MLHKGADGVWELRISRRSLSRFCLVAALIIGVLGTFAVKHSREQTMQSVRAQIAASVSALSVPTSTLTLTPTPIPTSKPRPTTVPTAASLKNIGIEPLLVMLGELPTGIEPINLQNSMPQAYISMNIRTPDAIIFQPLVLNDDPTGYIVVTLNNDAEKVKDTFDKIRKDDQFILENDTYAVLNDVKGVGNSAYTLTSKTFLPGGRARVVHCRATIDVYFSGAYLDGDSAMYYAKRLDKRITPLICPS